MHTSYYGFVVFVYPPIFIRTAGKDINVDPSNAFRMTAALQETAQGGPFIMSHYHRRAHNPATTVEFIDEYSTHFMFLIRNLMH